MQRLCIAVFDATRARLYTFETFAAAPGSHSQELTERIDLVNPARHSLPSERYSDTRPGTKVSSNGRSYAVDDGRDANTRDLDRRFAAEVAAALASEVREQGCHRAIVVASPRMLGHLRSTAGVLPPGLPIDEVGRDLTRLGSAQVHDHLAALGLMPPRERLATRPIT